MAKTLGPANSQLLGKRAEFNRYSAGSKTYARYFFYFAGVHNVTQIALKRGLKDCLAVERRL